MAYQLFQLPKATQIDSSVRVTPGAKANFYATGTVIRQNTYTDSALTIPSANPVVADANGVFPVIYLDSTLVYKLTLTTSADVLIYTVDPCNDQLLSALVIGALIYPRSAAEIASGVTPASYLYPPYIVDRYQVNTTPGTTNMYTGFLNAVTACSAGGGGVVACLPGSSYAVNTELVVPTNVKIDLNGATTTHNFANSSTDCGYRLRDNSSVYNGTITIVGTGTPVVGRDAWTCVVAGESGGVLAGYKQIRLRDLKLSSNRGDSYGGSGILVQSDCCDVVIENIYFPSSSTLGSGVRVAWAGDGGSPPTTSQHPHNVTVRNIKFGTMTKATSSFDISAIDIVGVYNVAVENVYCDRWAGDAVVQIRVGGQGDTVAPAAVKPLLFKGISVRNVECKECDSHGLLINGKANDAVGTPSNSVQATVENCKFVGNGLTNTAYGIRVLCAFDVVIKNCSAEQFLYNLYIEENTKRIKATDCQFLKSNKQNVAVVHGTAPEDIYLARVEAYLGGQDGTNQAGFDLDSCTRVTLEDCISGDAASETTQFYGFKTSSSALGTRIKGRARVRNFKGGGAKYSFSSAIAGDYQMHGGSTAAMSTTTTEFYPAVGVGAAGITAENGASVLTAIDLVFTNLSFKVTAAPTGATKTRTASLVDDGAATALNPTITDAAVTAVDYDTAEVAAGSYVSIQSTVANTPNAAFGKWSVEAFLG